MIAIKYLKVKRAFNFNAFLKKKFRKDVNSKMENALHDARGTY